MTTTDQLSQCMDVVPNNAKHMAVATRYTPPGPGRQ